jgi:hypothetical protein
MLSPLFDSGLCQWRLTLRLQRRQRSSRVGQHGWQGRWRLAAADEAICINGLPEVVANVAGSFYRTLYINPSKKASRLAESGLDPNKIKQSEFHLVMGRKQFNEFGYGRRRWS